MGLGRLHLVFAACCLAASCASDSIAQDAWTELTPEGPLPPARRAHSAIFDPIGYRMLVLGGLQDAQELGDLWTLSLDGGGTWSPDLAPGSWPAPRAFHSAVYDPVGYRMIVFGGVATDTTYGDLWSWSLGGANGWTPIVASGAGPAPRYAHGAAYDPARNRMIVFGGMDRSFVFYDDVWALDLGPAPSWTPLLPTGSPPTPTTLSTVLHDDARDRLLVCAGSTPRVWSLSLDASPGWQEIVPLGVPPSVDGAGGRGVIDPARDRMILYTAHYSNPVYALDLAHPSWTPLTPSGWTPKPRSMSSAVRDRTNRMLIFGGYGPVETQETWALALDHPTPVAVSVARVEPASDRVLIAWHVDGSPAARARVERGSDGSAWRVLGSPAVTATGDLEYTDREVAPGARYRYRLGFERDGEATWAGEVTVQVPVTMLLEPVRPSPATIPFTVAFTLPADGTARLEVFDLAGRRVAGREVGALGRGRHTVTIGSDRGLAPGMYRVRLRGIGFESARNVVVTR